MTQPPSGPPPFGPQGPDFSPPGEGTSGQPHAPGHSQSAGDPGISQPQGSGSHQYGQTPPNQQWQGQPQSGQPQSGGQQWQGQPQSGQQWQGQPQSGGQAWQAQYQPNGQSPQWNAAPVGVKGRNPVGIVALVIAVLGTIFAVWPGAFAVGWILLPIAFILSIIGLFLKDKGKMLAVVALVISVLGTVAGVIAFFALAAVIVDEAIDTETTVSPPPSGAPAQTPTAVEPTPSEEISAKPSTEQTASETEPTDDLGEGVGLSRGNPAPMGASVSSDDWEVTVNSFTPNATAEVMAENQFNDEVTEGNEYALVNVTAKRLGAESGYTYEISVDYITEAGNVIDGLDAIAVAPEDFSSGEELFEGAESTGNIALMVPVDDAGVIRVQPGLFADEVFFATS